MSEKLVRIRVQSMGSREMAERIVEILQSHGFEFIEISREYDAFQAGVGQRRTFLTALFKNS
jgi:hypothetical protein